MPKPRPATARKPDETVVSVPVTYRALSDLLPYARNARTHSETQVAQLAASIAEFGWTNPVLADGNGIVAGHGRVMAARLLNDQGKTIRLPSGSVVPAGCVPVIDCTGWTDAQRRAYVIADNKLALNADWDDDMLRVELQSIADDGLLAAAGFAQDEFDAFMSGTEGASDEEVAKAYSAKIDTPVYEPKGERPKIADLYDTTKALALLDAIEAADLPVDVRDFLRAAARRHTVFHYGRIAEWYCHASPEVQRLMEDSALVIIDFGRAIENGYVEVSRKLEGMFGDAYPEGDSSNADDD